MTDDTKDCPVCAETIKAASIKCRFCNTDLAAFAAQSKPQEEQLVYAGHPAVIYSVWQWLAVVVTLGIAYGYYWLHSISTQYEITSQRVRIERGILSKVKKVWSFSGLTISMCSSHWGCAWRDSASCISGRPMQGSPPCAFTVCRNWKSWATSCVSFRCRNAPGARSPPLFRPDRTLERIPGKRCCDTNHAVT